jgi:hypothetical protein
MLMLFGSNYVRRNLVRSTPQEVRMVDKMASFKKSELPEILFRMVAAGLTVGVLILLPAIKMIEAALS